MIQSNIYDMVTALIHATIYMDTARMLVKGLGYGFQRESGRQNFLHHASTMAGAYVLTRHQMFLVINLDSGNG